MAIHVIRAGATAELLALRTELELEREVKSRKRYDYRPYNGKYESPDSKPHCKSGYRPIAVICLLALLFFIHRFDLRSAFYHQRNDACSARRFRVQHVDSTHKQRDKHSTTTS